MLLFCSPSYVPSNNIPNFSKFRFLARLRSKRNIYTDFKINSEKKVFNASLNLEVNFSNSSSGYLHIAFVDILKVICLLVCVSVLLNVCNVDKKPFNSKYFLVVI